MPTSCKLLSFPAAHHMLRPLAMATGMMTFQVISTCTILFFLLICITNRATDTHTVDLTLKYIPNNYQNNVYVRTCFRDEKDGFCFRERNIHFKPGKCEFSESFDIDCWIAYNTYSVLVVYQRTETRNMYDEVTSRRNLFL
uniref:Uncharacterized protein n=1 Tax=Steinernema glaseri TaxID=37863 RepID=A0A1I8A174_9BILA